MKKVMIVGAGAGQVPLIQRCKERGLYTVVVSPYGPYPGIELADKHINEDIFNKDNLVEIGRKEAIDYVISDQSDYAVPIVAYVAGKLGLPGNSLEVAETYTFKSLFRGFCHRNGIPAPKSIVLELLNPDYNDVSKLKLPLVVKPADSQGSRGISKITNLAQLSLAVEEASRYSRNHKVVVEEFFQGREIVCEGFVINGEYINVAFGEREYFSLDGLFIPSKTRFPANLSEKDKLQLVENEKTIAYKLKPAFGIVHSEYLVNDDGDFVVIESALRGGGVYIASHLIPLSTGVDLTEVLVSAMEGNTIKSNSLLSPEKIGASEYLCFYLKKGNVTSISFPEEMRNCPNIVISEIDNIKIGDNIGRFEHKGMRKGPFIIKGKDFQEVKEIEKQIKDSLSIQVDCQPGIIWE